MPHSWCAFPSRGPDALAGRVFYVSTTLADVAELVKGRSPSSIGTLLTTLFWNLAARGATLWRSEYARTKSNHRDRPSRDRDEQNASMRSMGTGRFPPAFSHALISCGSLHRVGNSGAKIRNIERFRKNWYIFRKSPLARPPERIDEAIFKPWLKQGFAIF